MKIGIIVHSHTGNTYSVAQELKEKLVAVGHSVSVESVTASNDDESDAGQVQLTNKPDIDEYDAFIFGAPVRGLALSPVMAAYLDRLKAGMKKNAACFVTELFPTPDMGGNRAIDQMKQLCDLKEITVCGTGVVNWSNINRRKKILGIVEDFSRLFC